jgi:hypothetical protein
MSDVIQCDLCGEFYEYESEGKDEECSRTAQQGQDYSSVL